MAAFPYQHPLFLLDSVHLPNAPINISVSLEDGDINTTSYYPSPHRPLQETPYNNNDVTIHETTNNNTSGFNTDNEPSELDNGDHVSHKEISLANKRKTRDDSSSCSSLSKAVKEVKAKKQKKSINNGLKETVEKKIKSDKTEQEKVTEESPSGYIHVRARRGQATDSHSLAERVRREKISERMKLLQGLVPGCAKVTGKALMLDEIINYVQSLQYQVEFLSMKLASMHPILYDFGEDLDTTHMVKTEKVRSFGSPPIPSIHQSNPTQPTTFADTTPTLTTRNNNYSVQDNAVPSFLLQQGHLEMLNALSQDNENLLWDVEDQRQRFLN